MRTLTRWAVALLAGVVILGGVASVRVYGDDEPDRQMAGRLDRLERQLHQLAEQQQQFMQRVGGATEQRGPAVQGQWRPPDGPRPGAPQFGPPAPAVPQPGGPHEMTVDWPGHKAKAAFWCAVGVWRMVLLILFVVHITLAVWVYGDIRRRGEGHGVFIILALLAGIPATILYALIRIGDRKTG